MKKQDYFLKWAIVTVVTLAHIGIGALTWNNKKVAEPVAMTDLTMVDLDSMEGAGQSAAEGAPAPLKAQETELKPSTQPEKPPAEPSVVKTPKISAVVRNDVAADFRQPETLKPQSKTEHELPHPKSETTTSSTTQTPIANHRAADGAGGGGSDVHSKVPSNHSGSTLGDEVKGTKGSDNKSGKGTVIDGGYIGLPMPPYPNSARENDEEGTTKLVVVVNADGSVRSVDISHSSGSSALDNAAKRAARSARYRPKIIDGEAVATRFNTSFKFQLD